MKPIPIVAGRDIAERYGYDQVVIIARKLGDNGGEHVTTYGRDKANCDVAAHIGDFLKHEIMKWPGQSQLAAARARIAALEKDLAEADAFASYIGSIIAGDVDWEGWAEEAHHHCRQRHKANVAALAEPGKPEETRG